MQYIFRTLSLLMAIFILTPLCAIMYFMFGVFRIFNNFTYYNFIDSKVSDDKLDVIAFLLSKEIKFVKRFEILFRVIILFFEPIFTIFADIKNAVKTIRF